MNRIKIISCFGITALSAAVAMSEFKNAVVKTQTEEGRNKIRKHNYPHWHTQHRESK